MKRVKIILIIPFLIKMSINLEVKSLPPICIDILCLLTTILDLLIKTNPADIYPPPNEIIKLSSSIPFIVVYLHYFYLIKRD